MKGSSPPRPRGPRAPRGAPTGGGISATTLTDTTVTDTTGTLRVPVARSPPWSRATPRIPSSRTPRGTSRARRKLSTSKRLRSQPRTDEAVRRATPFDRRDATAAEVAEQDAGNREQQHGPGQRVIVAYLAPRKMKFGVSEGMVVAAGAGGKEVYVLAPDSGAKPGHRVH